MLRLLIAPLQPAQPLERLIIPRVLVLRQRLIASLGMYPHDSNACITAG
jgi:hypothetical protein